MPSGAALCWWLTGLLCGSLEDLNHPASSWPLGDWLSHGDIRGQGSASLTTGLLSCRTTEDLNHPASGWPLGDWLSHGDIRGQGLSILNYRAPLL